MNDWSVVVAQLRESFAEQVSQSKIRNIVHSFLMDLGVEIQMGYVMRVIGLSLARQEDFLQTERM